MKPILEVVDSVRQARVAFLETVASWNAEQGAFKPSAECWSASEVVEHVYASEFIVVNRLWTGIDGLRSNQPLWAGEHTNRGCSVEVVATVFETGKYKSPPVVDAKVGGPLAFWREALDSCQPLLNRLGSALENVDQEKIFFPHFVVGPLDANQWIEFLGLHLNRHRRQIERLRALEGFPA
jgi:hypothetical protein